MVHFFWAEVQSCLCKLRWYSTKQTESNLLVFHTVPLLFAFDFIFLAFLTVLLKTSQCFPTADLIVAVYEMTTSVIKASIPKTILQNVMMLCRICIYLNWLKSYSENISLVNYEFKLIKCAYIGILKQFFWERQALFLDTSCIDCDKCHQRRGIPSCA